MSSCDGCFFHETGYLWNGCTYFETEYYYEPNDCCARSDDGKLTAEQERKIFEETDGAFGKQEVQDD